MNKVLYKNEVIKRKFFSHLKDLEGFSEESVNSFEASILLWQDFAKEGDFVNLGKVKIIGFKNWLKNKNKAKGGGKISLSYCYHTLRKLRVFFEWLAKQPGYKSKINSSYIQFLKLSKKENRMAIEPKERPTPSMEEVKQVIENIKNKSETDLRDRALLSLAILTGARISAIISLPVKSFDRNNLTIDQDPTLGVKTKFGKRITTRLFPLGYEEPLKIFLEWFDYLCNEKKFKQTDPIFPATKIEQGEENINFQNTGKVEPLFWKNPGSARKIFEKRFKKAGITYYHPHSFRHLVVKELTKTPLTEEQKKAISQNLGHENVGTTFGSYGYGHIEASRQIDLVKSIKFSTNKEVSYNLTEDEIKRIVKKIKEED